jgi:hypothetical protein
MCVKRIPVVTKQFYALMMTSPKLASPVVLHMFSNYPSQEVIHSVGGPHIEKNRDWSLLVHFDQQPQLHVIPIQIPWIHDYESDTNTNKNTKNIPLLPVTPKVPYLA